jgi:hypothetical protein
LKAGVKVSQTFVTEKIIVPMAASVFKWLLLPLAGLVLISGKKTPVPHPVHISVIEINHNAADKTLEISCKIFTDDFEKNLAKNYKAKVDLTNPPDKAAMDTLVKKYIFSHLSLKADGRPVAVQYVGFESEGDAVYSYIEVDNLPAVKKVDVSANIMYDMFEDEVIIIHTIVGGNRKSNKLEFPNKETSFSF